jgi:hypothetical protein
MTIFFLNKMPENFKFLSSSNSVGEKFIQKSQMMEKNIFLSFLGVAVLTCCFALPSADEYEKNVVFYGFKNSYEYI